LTPFRCSATLRTHYTLSNLSTLLFRPRDAVVFYRRSVSNCSYQHLALDLVFHKATTSSPASRVRPGIVVSSATRERLKAYAYSSVDDFTSEVASVWRRQEDVGSGDFDRHARSVEGSDANAEVLHVRFFVAFCSGLEGCPDDARGD